MKRPQLRFVGAALAVLLVSAALFVRMSTAQHATPTVDGSIGLTEYGTMNSQASGGTTWYMTWDETNLYVGTTNANTTEGAVIYIDRHRPLVGAGTDADGNLTGQTYDSTNFSSLPFRADFVTYYKDGYREYRTADGAGGWSAATTLFGSYASNGSTVRELAIPWSAVTGAGRPDSFNFFAYATSPGGFVYGEVPTENPDGFIGTSATATRFYYVASTVNGASTRPFTQNFTQPRTFVVNSTADTSDATPGDNSCDAGGAVCTLRAAIQEANAVASLDAINFQIPAIPDPNCDDTSGICTISPASALPALTDPVQIDGYTQTGATANTLATGNDAALKIELNGTGAGAGVEGLTINGGTTTVRGLVINRFGGRGIEMGGADFNVVTGCFIGTDPGGTVDLGNSQAGVFIQGLVGGSDTNRVGGTGPAERNLVSGNNGDGIGGAGGGANTIQGNYVGTDRNGTADLGNSGNGVVLAGAGSLLGGTTAAARNVVSGNDGVGGVAVSGGGHVIQGNYIGTDATGALDLGNNGNGISFNVTNGTTVGGAAAGAGNLVSGNGQDGVQIGNSSNVTVRGNLIGTNAAGTAPLANGANGVHLLAGTSENNQIGGTGAGESNVIAFNGADGVFMADTNTTRNPVLSNSIHTNTGLGLDLNPNGVNANDPLDPDAGPNRLQNYPVLTAVITSGGTTTVAGTLNSTPSSTFRVEFFSNASCDASGNGEGQTFLGAKTVVTDALGNAVFTSDPLGPVPTSRPVTATATVTNDPADATNVNNTSEFSQCAQEPAAAATYVVNSTGDASDLNLDDGICLTATPGECTLRAAIEQANANPSADTINFLILLTNPGCFLSGVCTISPASALPAVSRPATIDGYTQPGSSQNTLAVGDNAVINIELNGAGAGAGSDGLRFTAGSSAVRGLAVYSFAGDGVELSGAGSNTVAGNFIGHTSQGNVPGFGNGGDGVNVSGVASNTVGGALPAARNLIAQNGGDGVSVSGVAASANTVAGNYIGTDRNGTADFGNLENGVILAAPSNTVGGSTATPGQGAGNVIGGNALAGVRVTTGGNNNAVAGNFIGLQSNGTAALRNDLEGVFITNGASSNTVGGATSDLRNVISGHNFSVNSDGVEINGAGTNNNTVAGNYIGTNAAGTVAVPNIDGVELAAGAQSNTVGGATATAGVAPGNVVAGNTSDGVEITGTNTSSNTVAGNLIGLAVGGTSALANSTTGVNILGNASSNTVGGSASNLRNVISANGDGVVINGANSNTVAGNYIGTDITGALDRGNVINGVVITGGAQSNSIGGLTATPGTAPGNVIGGNASDGVEIAGSTSSSNTVRGNLIGLAAGGTAVLRNDANGVLISAATSNTVGGATATARNVITGGTAATSDGVDLQGADNTVVAGNYVGTDINGTGVNGGASDFGSGGDGVRVSSDSDNCTVGGSTATPGTAPGNVISGNNSDGVEIAATGSAGNLVQGNLIGTQADGTTAYANGANGVLISAIASTPSNTVGGSTATPGTGVGNVISGNTTNGVQVSSNADSCLVRGNLIGLAVGGAAALGNGTNGVHFTGTINSTVGGATSDLRNVISANGSNGVLLNEGQNATGDNNTVAGNYIGTDITGAVDLGNAGDGVHVNGGDVSTVGGLAATTGQAPGNVISGNNSDGVDLTETSGDTNTINIRGNFIGLKANGTEALGNTGDGVGIRAGVTVSVVGGTTATARNVISANGSDGVELASGGHTVQGNYVGTQADGASALGNTAHGVHVSAANTTVINVGGAAAGTGNTIAFNGGDGVFVPVGYAAVRRNAVHSNTGLGIDLGADGVTPNDPDDPDTGGNNLQNFPVLTSAMQGSTVVQGTLNSTPSTVFTVEFFSTPVADPSGNGEGQTFLDSTSVTTDANGDATFNHTIATTVPVGHYVTATATDPTGRTSEFSDAEYVLSVTLARLVSFKATRDDSGTLLEWKTSYEVENLGFNLYREVAGARTLVNPTLVAGSALVAGPGVALTAGNTYSWTDAAGGAGALYYLEEVDLAGQTKTYGPFAPSRVAGRSKPRLRSPTISGLTDDSPPPPDAQRQWTRTDARAARLTRAHSLRGVAAAQDEQRRLASLPAVKLGVRAAGWYRVTRAQLTAAGLSPTADPARLRMYEGGVEVPIRTGADGSVEFYGEGLDVPSTDTRVYWLVEGDAGGLRTDAPRTTPETPGGGEEGDRIGAARGTSIITIVPVDPTPAAPEYFSYTVERRERTLYFSALQNGEAENFFGKVVTSTAAAQTLTVRNLYASEAPGTATLEVALQGVTAGAHSVNVLFNGSQVGTLDFSGPTRKAAVFPVASYLLREGDNSVELVSSAPSDVSLTEHLRLTYLHSMRADDDRLRFAAPPGPVTVGGFSTPQVRFVDVTDPASPFELFPEGDALPNADGRYSVTVNVAGAGERQLFAFADTRVMSPASVAANVPSTWSEGAGREADLVVITHADFAQQVAPLVAQRAAEGMRVEVLDVEDLFDEFSYGAHTPQAVRDFLAWTRANWERAPAYVLLVGDGSHDPRDHLNRGRYDLVPSKLVDAGLMETASDDWFADFDDDGISDTAVGRLPVRTQAEAATVVNKIVSRTFDESQPAALMVADRTGADGFDFEAATDGVQSLLPAGFNVARVNRGAQDAATVRGQILSGVNAGPLLVNWLGHGSVDVWTGDGLLRGSDAPALTNGSRLPLFVMMTCLNGYYAGTVSDSLAESVLKAGQGGAYAVWASSGLTAPRAQSDANRELYRVLFDEGDAVRLGDAVRRAKAATADRDVRRTWVFFGDPSSRLR